MTKLIFQLVCQASALLLPVETMADSSGDAVLAKYRALAGWTLGDSKTQSIRITGQIAGLTRFDEICEPDRFAQFNVSFTSGRSFLVEGNQGSAWTSHAGVAKDLLEPMAQDELSQSLLLCNAFANYPATIVFQVTKGTNSKLGYATVAVQPPNSPLLIIVINEDTGEITSVDVNEIATYEPADLKPVDANRKIYTRWKRELPDGSTAEMSVSSLQFNVTTNPHIFAKNANDVPPPPDAALVIKF